MAKSFETTFSILLGVGLLLVAGLLIFFSASSMKSISETNAESSENIVDEVSTKLDNIVLRSAEDLLVDRAKSQAHLVESRINKAMDAARTISQLMMGLKAKGASASGINRDRVILLLKEVLRNNPDFMGIYTCWELDHFDGNAYAFENLEGHDETGRFIPYWFRDSLGELSLHPHEHSVSTTPNDKETHLGEVYLTTLKRGGECVINPFIKKIKGTEVWCTSLMSPIIVDGKFYGLVGVDLRLQNIQSLAETVSDGIYNGKGQVLFISNNGTVVADSREPSRIGQSMSVLCPATWDLESHYMYSTRHITEFANGVIKVFFPLKIGRSTTPWMVNILLPEEVVMREAKLIASKMKSEMDKVTALSKEKSERSIQNQLLIGGCVCLVVLAMIIFIVRKEMRMMREAESVLQLEVAKHKQTADALEKSENDLEITLNSIGDAVIATNIEGKITRMNPVALKLSGWTLEDAKGKELAEVLKIFNSKTREVAVNPVEKVLASGEIVGLANHTMLLSKNGVEYQISDSAAPIRGVDGEINGVVLVFRDVTQEYEMREKEIASEAKFRALVESSSDLIWEVDTEGVYTYISPKVESILGYKPEEIVGKSIFDFMPPEETKRISSVFNNLIGANEAFTTLENITVHKDGRNIILETNGVPVVDADGKVTGYRGVDRDITERKEAEKRLMTEQTFSDTIIQSMPGLFYIFEKGDAHFLRRNNNWNKVTGFSDKELASMTALDVVADSELCAQRIAEVFEKGASTMENNLITKSGAQIPYYFTGDRFELDDKTYLVGLGLDMSERKRAEEELASFNKAMVGREVRILEMKRKVNDLCLELGRDLVYDQQSSLEKDQIPEHAKTLEKTNFEDLLKIVGLENILQSFCESVGIASAIIDLKGKVLIKANWQRICTDFHRMNEESCRRCIESDTFLANQIESGNKYAIYRCKNGLADAASPIVVDGCHVANVFIGQFHTSTPDEKLFREQAIQYGFNEKDYLQALREVPIIPQEKLTPILSFLSSVAEVSAIMCLDRLRAENSMKSFQDRQIELNEQRQAALSLMEDARRAEEELNNLRNYLSNIINSMPSVLIGVDANCKVTQWNKTAEQSTGITPEIAQGKNLSDIFPHMASEIDRINESIVARKPKYEQKRLRHSTDAVFYEDITIYPLITNGVEGAVIRIDDVTEQVRMEEMMIQSEKMLSVGGLAAGMAHEINNPLSGIMQTANVLSNRLSENIDMPANMKAAEKVGVTVESIREFMEIRGVPRMIAAIKASGQRVAAIVENMLSFARKSESNMSSHDLELILEKTLDLAATDYDLKKHYDFKQIEITKDFDGNLPNVPCEVGKIQQVLLNVFRNGAQAMQEAKTDNPKFIIRTRHEINRGMVRVEIENNGPGMDEETRKRVFEPFYTTKPVGEGTGLGLSVSYFIICENHGGEMEVESESVSGVKFIICLPVEGGKA